MEQDKTCRDDDFIALGPQNEDGSVSAIRHTKDHQVMVGTVSPLREGEPITGEVVKLEPRGDGTFSCETIFSPDETRGKGPAMVNSRLYRDSWDRIWNSDPSKAN